MRISDWGSDGCSSDLVGTVALMAGFLSARPAAYAIAIALVAVGFAVFLAAAVISLVRAAGNITVWGMRLAVASLGLTVMLGLEIGRAPCEERVCTYV